MFRRSFLSMHNEKLVVALREVAHSYSLAAGGIDHADREMAYLTAADTIAALDAPITDAQQVRGLRGIGPKMLQKVESFLQTGTFEPSAPPLPTPFATYCASLGTDPTSPSAAMQWVEMTTMQREAYAGTRCVGLGPFWLYFEERYASMRVGDEEDEPFLMSRYGPLIQNEWETLEEKQRFEYEIRVEAHKASQFLNRRRRLAQAKEKNHGRGGKSSSWKKWCLEQSDL